MKLSDQCEVEVAKLKLHNRSCKIEVAEVAEEGNKAASPSGQVLKLKWSQKSPGNRQNAIEIPK